MRRLTLRLCIVIAVISLAFDKSAASGTVINIRDYGAVGDGAHNDTSAIQGALDSGASTVLIPAGTYSINQTLLVNSGTTVQADANAVLRLANGANAILLNNRPNASNISIQGGVWDGNNQYNQRGANNDPNGYCGSAINFFGVDRLTLTDLTVRNPDAFGIRLGNVENFTVKNISLDYSVPRLNQDGVHVNGNSHHGLISGIKAISPNTPNDDMVALNADDSLTMTEVLVHGQQNGPISDVVVENIRADNAYTFVRLYSNTSRLENITLRDMKGGFRYYAITIGNHDFPVGAGDIRTVTVDDFNVTKTTAALSGFPVIDIGLKVRNLHLTNFVRGENAGTAATPTLVLRNGLDNVIRLADGSEQQVRDYTVSQGGLTDFWLNPVQTPEPSGCTLLATGILAIAIYCLRSIRKVFGDC